VAIDAIAPPARALRRSSTIEITQVVPVPDRGQVESVDRARDRARHDPVTSPRATGSLVHDPVHAAGLVVDGEQEIDQDGEPVDPVLDLVEPGASSPAA